MDYTHCTLCPRRCGVDRTAGERGFCGMGDTLRIARAAVHYGEEPAIAGSFGAGAVFFSGCSLGCVYCQNEAVSHGGLGKDVTPERLREIFLELPCHALREEEDSGLRLIGGVGVGGIPEIRGVPAYPPDLLQHGREASRSILPGKEDVVAYAVGPEPESQKAYGPFLSDYPGAGIHRAESI